MVKRSGCFCLFHFYYKEQLVVSFRRRILKGEMKEPCFQMCDGPHGTQWHKHLECWVSPKQRQQPKKAPWAYSKTEGRCHCPMIATITKGNQEGETTPRGQTVCPNNMLRCTILQGCQFCSTDFTWDFSSVFLCSTIFSSDFYFTFNC